MKLSCLALLACSVLTFCTSQQPTAVAESDPRFPECNGCSKLENLYYFADTTFTRHDSLFIVNNRLDTTVVETGIFTYPQHSFPVCTPSYLVKLIRQGVQAETDNKPDQAINYYRKAISFYQDDWLKRKAGFENGGFSDLNDYYAANVNVTILISYAFEKLRRLPEALSTIAPFLANSETEHSKIQLRYIELCIQRYGRAATKKALDASGETAHRAQSESVYSDWTVSVFGANLGVGFCTDHYASDSLSQLEAQCFIREQPFHALVN